MEGSARDQGFGLEEGIGGSTGSSQRITGRDV